MGDETPRNDEELPLGEKTLGTKRRASPAGERGVIDAAPASLGVYDRSTRTIIFDRGIHKYVRVIEIMTFDQVYVTDFNCNLPRLRVGLIQVTILDLSITLTL